VATLREIKRRIRSVKNTQQMTKAMEMVAASKMRRAQQRVLSARPYAEKMREVLSDLAAQQGEEFHPLLQKREPVRKISLVLITTDRGLCGGLNANLLRVVAHYMAEQEVPIEVVSVGRKGRDFIRRTDVPLTATFTNIGDQPSYTDTLPISRIVMEDYTAEKIDKVMIAYTNFISTLSQKPVIRQLLPVQPPEEAPELKYRQYIYEPSAVAVLASLLPRFLENQIYHAILEAISSEHSARMVAMRNATENASDLIGELTLTYNKARQASITKEIIDIASGAEALSYGK